MDMSMESTSQKTSSRSAVSKDMELQVCVCGWSKATTVRGLKIHQGRMKCLREKGQGPRIDQYFLRSQSSQSNEIQRQEANHSSQDISTPVIDVRRTCMDTVSDEPNDPCEPALPLSPDEEVGLDRVDTTVSPEAQSSQAIPSASASISQLLHSALLRKEYLGQEPVYSGTTTNPTQAVPLLSQSEPSATVMSQGVLTTAVMSPAASLLRGQSQGSSTTTPPGPTPATPSITSSPQEGAREEETTTTLITTTTITTVHTPDFDMILRALLRPQEEGPVFLANESLLSQGQVIRSLTNQVLIRFQSNQPANPGVFKLHFQGWLSGMSEISEESESSPSISSAPSSLSAPPSPAASSSTALSTSTAPLSSPPPSTATAVTAASVSACWGSEREEPCTAPGLKPVVVPLPSPSMSGGADTPA
ncbi:UNVERIFIED_CONTAM: hypothetical protein FKN15_062958 [Acipenser sinensis]